MLSLLVGACWDKLSYLLQGNVSDKVRVSDQPDIVSSLTEWFVGFSLNSCFPFLICSETLKQQPGVFGSSSDLPPDPRTAGGGQFIGFLERAGPSIWQILRPVQEGLCNRLVFTSKLVVVLKPLAWGDGLWQLVLPIPWSVEELFQDDNLLVSTKAHFWGVGWWEGSICFCEYFDSFPPVAELGQSQGVKLES